MSKQDVIGAIERYIARQTKTKSSSRKNRSPEKELVRTELMPWLRSKGFYCHVVESKATYNESLGRYLTSQTTVGMPDIIGCDSKGLSVFVEAKAKGRLSTLRDMQREFLVEVIQRGGFGVVVDSRERLEELYSAFSSLPSDLAKQYLLDQLPKKKKSQPDDSDWLDF